MADARAYNALYGGILGEQPLSYRTPLRQPNALMGPVWENNHAAPQQAPQRPSDWAVSSGVAEAISPTIGMYGLGAGLGSTYAAAKAGDYGGALEAGLPLAAMAMMPGPKGMGKMPAAAEQPKGIRAYHGSPHDFERFDSSKIGTGEGAQAYGHGLYFSENPKVARSYEGMLASNGYDPAVIARDALVDAGGNPAQALAALEKSTPPKMGLPEFDILTDNYGIAKQHIQNHMSGQSMPLPERGRMYEVNIKADPEHFIDNEKRISEHPKHVQDLLAGWRNTQLYRNHDRLGIKDPSAGGAFGALSKDDPAGWAQKAAEAGIPGIRYLDQGSRGAGEGSRNYVVFDAATIEILRKYGLLGPMAGGVGVNALMQDQNQ